MADAAMMAEQMGVSLIDINMGCHKKSQAENQVLL